MGYGTKALELLKQYYELKILNINESSEICTTEISKVQNEEMNLLEERIGNCIYYRLKIL